MVDAAREARKIDVLPQLSLCLEDKDTPPIWRLGAVETTPPLGSNHLGPSGNLAVHQWLLAAAVAQQVGARAVVVVEQLDDGLAVRDLAVDRVGQPEEELLGRLGH